MYTQEVIKRVKFEASHVIKTECTIRELVDYMAKIEDGKSISKTTAHRDMAVKLPEIDWDAYLNVREIFNKHRDEAPIRAGKAIHEKWQKIKTQGS